MKPNGFPHLLLKYPKFQLLEVLWRVEVALHSIEVMAAWNNNEFVIEEEEAVDDGLLDVTFLNRSDELGRSHTPMLQRGQSVIIESQPPLVENSTSSHTDRPKIKKKLIRHAKNAYSTSGALIEDYQTRFKSPKDTKNGIAESKRFSIVLEKFAEGFHSLEVLQEAIAGMIGVEQSSAVELIEHFSKIENKKFEFTEGVDRGLFETKISKWVEAQRSITKLKLVSFNNLNQQVLKPIANGIEKFKKKLAEMETKRSSYLTTLDLETESLQSHRSDCIRQWIELQDAWNRLERRIIKDHSLKEIQTLKKIVDVSQKCLLIPAEVYALVDFNLKAGKAHYTHSQNVTRILNLKQFHSFVDSAEAKHTSRVYGSASKIDSSNQSNASESDQMITSTGIKGPSKKLILAYTNFGMKRQDTVRLFSAHLEMVSRISDYQNEIYKCFLPQFYEELLNQLRDLNAFLSEKFDLMRLIQVKSMTESTSFLERLTTTDKFELEKINGSKMDKFPSSLMSNDDQSIFSFELPESSCQPIPRYRLPCHPSFLTSFSLELNDLLKMDIIQTLEDIDLFQKYAGDNDSTSQMYQSSSGVTPCLCVKIIDSVSMKSKTDTCNILEGRKGDLIRVSKIIPNSDEFVGSTLICRKRSPEGKFYKSAVEVIDFNETISLNHLLEVPLGRKLFRIFSVHEHSEEELDFLLDIEDYQATPSPKKAESIMKKYVLSQTADNMVNLSSERRKELLDLHESRKWSHNSFDRAQSEIYTLLSTDSFSRFKRSPLFQEKLLPQIRLWNLLLNESCDFAPRGKKYDERNSQVMEYDSFEGIHSPARTHRLSEIAKSLSSSFKASKNF